MQPLYIILGSNFFGLLIGGLFFLSAGWIFDLNEMGVYGLAASIQVIAVGFVGNGIGVATVRLASDYLTEGDYADAAGIVAYSFMIPAALSVLTAGICFVIFKNPSESVLLNRGLLVPLVLWAGAASMLACLRSGLLAQRQYKMAGMLTIMSGVTGLISLSVVLLIAPLTVSRLLMAHMFGLGTSALLGLCFLKPLCREGITFSINLFLKLWRYARWPALSEGIRLFQANMGPLLLAAVAGSDQVGLFSLARYPALLFGMIAVSLYQYWLPEVTREKGADNLIRFLRRQMRLAGLAGACMLIGAVVFRPILPFLGTNFAAAAPLFILSTLDFVLFLLVRPIESVYHGLHKPQLELVLRVVRMPVLVGLGLILSSHYGAVGMVWANVLSGFSVMGIAIWLLCKYLGSCPYIWNIWKEKKSVL